MSFISKRLGDIFVKVVGAEYLGNDRIVQGLAPHLDHKMKELHSRLLEQYAEIFGVSVTKMLEVHHINPKEDASFKVKTIYEKAINITDLNYKYLIDKQPDLESGVQIFKFTQAYHIFLGFQHCGSEGAEILKSMKSESKSPDANTFSEKQQQILQQVKHIHARMPFYQKKLVLLNQFVFLKKLPGGETFLENIGKTLSERLEYIKTNPDKIVQWITSSPTLQECEKLNLSCLVNFTVPAWISLLPNLKVLELLATRNLRFQDNFNPPNLQKINLYASENPYFGKTFSPQTLHTLDLSETVHTHFRENFNPKVKVLNPSDLEDTHFGCESRTC